VGGISAIRLEEEQSNILTNIIKGRLAQTRARSLCFVARNGNPQSLKDGDREEREEKTTGYFERYCTLEEIQITCALCSW
jgi:hypothetical protein